MNINLSYLDARRMLIALRFYIDCRPNFAIDDEKAISVYQKKKPFIDLMYTIEELLSKHEQWVAEMIEDKIKERDKKSKKDNDEKKGS